ncbi:MAG TPA: DUF418 domain-containing protein [Gemmataceae bacterium]|nr:DUF418 domain-containing protein [Gemmataceae bacterium]
MSDEPAAAAPDTEATRPPTDPAPRPAAPAVGPVTASERIRALDTLRGVAVLGILLLNIFGFGLPASFQAVTNPSVTGGDLSPPNLLAWFATYVLFDGRFRAIFSMLFGAGALLLLERADRRGAGIRAADIYYRRTLWLLLFGVLHAYLVWWGDVLYWFGVFGLALFPLRNQSPGFLLTAGLILLHSYIPIHVIDHIELLATRDKGEAAVAAARAARRPPTEQERADWWAWEQKKRELNPPAPDLAKEVEAQRAGWWPVFLRRAGMASYMQSTSIYRYGLSDILSMMLIGMGLMKLGVFTGELSAKSYRWLVLLGYGVGLPLSYGVALEMIQADFDVLEVGLLHHCTFPIARLAVALGHVGVVMLLCRATWLWWVSGALAAVGRMALTNYLTQSVLCTAYFDGWGLGRFGTLDRSQLLYVVVAVWAFQLVISPIWLAFFRFGPVEWVWRALTYWQWPPMLARNEPAGTPVVDSLATEPAPGESPG